MIYFAQEGWKSRILNKLKDWKRSFNNQMAASAIIEAPAVMTAAGQKINRNGQVEYNHTDDSGVKQLRSNLQTIGEAATAAPTIVGDVAATYQVLRHPVRTAKAIKQTLQTGVKALKENYHYPWEIIKKNRISEIQANQAFEKYPQRIGDIIQRNKLNSEISKYANSQVDPMLSIQKRLEDPEYVKMLKNNNFYFDGDIKYFENLDEYNIPEEMVNIITENFLKKRPEYQNIPIETVKDTVKKYVLIPQIQSGSPFAYGIKNKPLGIVGIQDPLIYPEIPYKGTRRYNILKSHETNHALTIPKTKPPIDVYGREYFSKENGTEIAARGTQIKDYFNKKKISAEELQYAAENYVKDTGLDNNMSDLFSIIRRNAQKDPEVWKKLAKWISEVSPAVIGFTPVTEKQ